MMARCAICREPLTEPEREGARLCVLCAHRTTERARPQPRPLEAGVLDTA